MEKLVSLQERIDGRQNKVSVYYSRDGLFQKECSPRAREFVVGFAQDDAVGDEEFQR